MATHSSVLAWKIPGMGEPGGLPSMGLHRVGHDWSDLAAAAGTGMCCLGVIWMGGGAFGLIHRQQIHKQEIWITMIPWKPSILGEQRLLNKSYMTSACHQLPLHSCPCTASSETKHLSSLEILNTPYRSSLEGLFVFFFFFFFFTAFERKKVSLYSILTATQNSLNFKSFCFGS